MTLLFFRSETVSICLKNVSFILLNSKRVKNYTGNLSKYFPLFINDKIHSSLHLTVDMNSQWLMSRINLFQQHTHQSTSCEHSREVGTFEVEVFKIKKQKQKTSGFFNGFGILHNAICAFICFQVLITHFNTSNEAYILQRRQIFSDQSCYTSYPATPLR